MKFNWILILGLTTLIACEDPRQQEVSDLQSQCVAIHDEIMPWLDTMEGLELKLKRWHDEIASDTTEQFIMLKQRLSETIVKLDSADEAMMDWMVSYNPKFGVENSVDSAVVYFDNQKGEINYIKQLMQESIDEAKALLAEY